MKLWTIKGLARSLNADSSAVDEKQTQISIDIEPTEEGIQKWQEIVRIVFQYLKLILDLPVEELKAQLEAIWKPYEQELKSYKPEACHDPFCLLASVQIITSNMMTTEPSEWITHNEEAAKLDSQWLQDLAAKLTPENFMIHLIAPSTWSDLNQD